MGKDTLLCKRIGNYEVLEGDSLVVIKALLDEDASLASYGLLVEDAEIHSMFWSITLLSYKRKSNFVTHNLVRYAINISDFLV